MTEKHGVATRLMYQLYVALNNKKKSNLTGVAMETMRPAAPAKLNAVESGIYKEVSAIKNELIFYLLTIVIEIRPNYTLTTKNPAYLISLTIYILLMHVIEK